MLKTDIYLSTKWLSDETDYSTVLLAPLFIRMRYLIPTTTNHIEGSHKHVNASANIHGAYLALRLASICKYINERILNTESLVIQKIKAHLKPIRDDLNLPLEQPPMLQTEQSQNAFVPCNCYQASRFQYLFGPHVKGVCSHNVSQINDVSQVFDPKYQLTISFSDVSTEPTFYDIRTTLEFAHDLSTTDKTEDIEDDSINHFEDSDDRIVSIVQKTKLHFKTFFPNKKF